MSEHTRWFLYGMAASTAMDLVAAFLWGYAREFYRMYKAARRDGE
jgi:hypothetical protein